MNLACYTRYHASVQYRCNNRIGDTTTTNTSSTLLSVFMVQVPYPAHSTVVFNIIQEGTGACHPGAIVGYG